MRHWLSNRRLDESFRVVVIVKGIDGLLEVIGGLALIVFPPDRIQGLIADLTTREIAEDPHAFIANFVLMLDSRIHPHAQLFAVVYLLGHGTIKLLLAFALLRRVYQLYPVAIAFLLAFIVYQAYRIGYDHSLILAVFTLFDCLVVWLTYQEWQRHREAAAG